MAKCVILLIFYSLRLTYSAEHGPIVDKAFRSEKEKTQVVVNLVGEPDGDTASPV